LGESKDSAESGSIEILIYPTGAKVATGPARPAAAR
jgi:hypothetical protein